MDSILAVECKDGSEFNELNTGYIYHISQDDIGSNSFRINGKWYGQSNFNVKAM